MYLCADVTDIADGATAKINIVEKDDDGNDDFVAEVSTSVQKGKIRRKWKVVYMADDDDTDSQQELEEKGYTLPEYAFTVECDGTKSGESGQLDVMGWILATIRNKESGAPMPNQDYVIYKTDGNIIKGTTDKNGTIDIKNLAFGEYYLSIEK